MKTCFEWLSVFAFACLLVGVVTTAGCGQSGPPPAPAVEETPTPDYEAGEAAYQK
jgi:predicted small lipoprotein YifL